MRELHSYLENKGFEFTQNEELDQVFESLSQRTEGLKHIDNMGELKAIAESRENLEDIIYTFKFINNTNVFKDILDEEALGFENLDQIEREEVLKYAKIFHNVLNNPPIIYNHSKIKAGEEGMFISYVFVNQEMKMKNDEKAYITWKANKENHHIFDDMLTRARIDSECFLSELRSSGDLQIIEKDNNIYVYFEGDSSKQGSLNTYSPVLIQNFEEEIKGAFRTQEQFQEKEIILIY